MEGVRGVHCTSIPSTQLTTPSLLHRLALPPNTPGYPPSLFHFYPHDGGQLNCIPFSRLASSKTLPTARFIYGPLAWGFLVLIISPLHVPLYSLGTFPKSTPLFIFNDNPHCPIATESRPMWVRFYHLLFFSLFVWFLFLFSSVVWVERVDWAACWQRALIPSGLCAGQYAAASRPHRPAAH